MGQDRGGGRCWRWRFGGRRRARGERRPGRRPGLFPLPDAGSLTVLLGKMAEIIEGAATNSRLAGRQAAGQHRRNAGSHRPLAARTRRRTANPGQGSRARLRPHPHRPRHRRHGRPAEACAADDRAPLAAALSERIRRFANAFPASSSPRSRCPPSIPPFTGIYLVAALPLLGIHLPLTRRWSPSPSSPASSRSWAT